MFKSFSRLKRCVFISMSVFIFEGCKSENVFGNDVLAPQTKTVSVMTKQLSDNWEQLKKRKLRLIPVPKQIEFTGKTVELPENAVVVLGNDSKEGQISAEEIVSRIKELTGKEIPVLKEIQKGTYNIVIENHWPNFFNSMNSKVETQNPFCRKQAYGIQPFADGIRLAGNSPLGMMYAAVTLRYLIDRDGDKVILYPAEVIDWPDFPRRMLTEFTASYHYDDKKNPEKHMENMKKFIDWAFRLKCNMVSGHTFIPYYTTHSPFYDKPLVEDDKIFASASLVSDYMHARDMLSYSGTNVALGYIQDKDQPEVKEMLYNPVHKRYYSWARHDLHRKKAEKMAELYSKLGYDVIFIHSIDGGGFRDPELWSERDKLTREKYGNDRVQADADMFNVYINIFKKKGLEPSLVIYPYSGMYLEPDFGLKKLGLPDTPENRNEAVCKTEEIKNFMQRINKKLPADVSVCIREGLSSEMYNFYRQYSERPMQIYFEVLGSHRDILSLLPAEISNFISAYDPSRNTNDILWLNMPRKFWEQASVCGAEYAWNTAFPGNSELDRKRNPVNYDPETLEIMAERTAVGLWGYEAGIKLKDIFSDQFSFFLAYDPKRTVAALNLKNMLELEEKNYHAALKAEKAMDQVWKDLKKYEKKPGKIMDTFSYPIFVTYYKMMKAAVAYATVNYYEGKGIGCAKKGDMAGVVSAVAEGRGKLAGMMTEYDRIIKELQGEPALVEYSQLQGWWRNSDANSDSNLLQPEFNDLKKKLDNLNSRKEAIFEQYNVPSWFKKFICSRKLAAIKISTPVEIDGKLTEKCWNIAQPIEHYIATKNMKMPSHPIKMMMLHDDKNIYIAGKIDQPLLPQIMEPKRSGNEYAFTESIEVFLMPDRESGNYFQFIVDTAGNLFAQKKNVDGNKKAQPVSGLKVASSRESGKWFFELAVPFTELGRKPDNDWAAMLCYNSIQKSAPQKLIESFSSTDVEGKGFHCPEKYQPLQFCKQAIANDAKVTIAVFDGGMAGKTHATGTGSQLTFGVKLESERPLYGVELKARFLDKDRNPVGENMTLLQKKYLPLSWESTVPFKKQLEETHRGVILELVLTCRTSDGAEHRIVKEEMFGDRNFLLSKKKAFIEGTDSGGHAFDGPFFFDVAGSEVLVPDLSRGTISFLVKPHWDAINKELPQKEYRTFLHYGPLPENEKLIARNRKHLSIFMDRKNGIIYFYIANNKYSSRSVYASLKNWKKEQWHHLVFVWDLTGENAVMEIYADGISVSGKVSDESGNPGKVMQTMPMKFSVQLGAMNSGLQPADAAFDDLMILKGSIDEQILSSSNQKAIIQMLEKTDGIFFDFNNDILCGLVYQKGLKKQKVIAYPGVVSGNKYK
ncbi:MAG: hypothetical protein A2017_12960 [Lentisphaerae bacterium GWF2_44_16]|nr:MAG: hypothetical protein A2017_12960 [Lentisphaerae bacterium GWF2_44_16]